jgi:hypothetical protein
MRLMRAAVIDIGRFTRVEAVGLPVACSCCLTGRVEQRYDFVVPQAVGLAKVFDGRVFAIGGLARSLTLVQPFR